MQISSVNLNSFKGNSQQHEMDSSIGAEFPKYRFTQENADELRKVANEMDKDANKVTTPLKYFTVSAIMAGLAFLVGKNATSRILKYGIESTKPIPNYINKLRSKTGNALVNLMHKANNKTLRSMYAKLARYGRDAFADINADSLKQVFTGKMKQSVLGGINKALALGVGTGAAALNITKRYEDKDKNGIPDRAEHAMSVIKEGTEALKAIADAAGLL